MEKEVELQTVVTKQNHEGELEKLRVMIRAREDTIERLQRKIDKNEMTSLQAELDRYCLQQEYEQEEELKIISKEIEESELQLKVSYWSFRE